MKYTKCTVEYLKATVITNLISAIPWIGNDVVTLLWIILSITPIGTIKWSYIRGERRAPYDPQDIEKFIKIPYNSVARLVGLIDGEGYLPTRNVEDYIQLALHIGINVRDLPLLEELRAEFNNIGIISPPNDNNIVYWTIYRTDLQEVLFPLIIHHGIFFLNPIRREQYNLQLYVIETGITRYQLLPTNVPISMYLPPLPNAEGIFNLPFFVPWVVGFTIGEGSFLFKNNGDACFQIHHRTVLPLFEALKILFQTTRKLGYDNDGKYIQLSVSSKKDIRRVVDFFSSTCPILAGHKLIQYNAWLEGLKNSKRYSKIF